MTTMHKAIIFFILLFLFPFGWGIIKGFLCVVAVKVFVFSLINILWATVTFPL